MADQTYSIQLGQNFRDVQLVGSGGMGSVYRAFDLGLNREVAIKVIRASEMTSDQLKRFRSEAKTLSKLNHPNVIRVHSIGQLDDMAPFMVLEYIQGESLDVILDREGRMPLWRAEHLFVQLAEALAHAHSEGIIHRDVKPSNVLLTRDDNGREMCKLVDFGIARNSVSATQVTMPGTMIGSPAYASPEQCTGQAIDARSDIYSLGCLMYEVLTGRRPFAADTVLEVVMQHCSEDPAPMDHVPAGIEHIVRRCMMKRADDRFASANDLISALSQGDTTVPNVKKTTMRKAHPHKPGAKIAGVLGGAILVSAIALTGILQTHKSSSHAAEASQMRTEATEGEGNRLRDLKQWSAAEQCYKAVLKNSNTTRTPEIWYQIANTQIKQGPARYHDATESYQNSVEFAEVQNMESPWRYRMDYARSLQLQNRFPESEGTLRRLPLTSPQMALAKIHFMLGLVEENRKDYSSANDTFENALSEWCDGSEGGSELRKEIQEHLAKARKLKSV